ncbi:MAG TPA: glycosyltransferase family 39 protein [Blastocatellia bacterium]|nr:glycosyltransferase family 39 protein [Blastocatellia bacterium]
MRTPLDTIPPNSTALVNQELLSADPDEVEIIEDAWLPAKLRPRLVAALLAVLGVTFFFGLGRLALIGPDEPRYAEVAREMFVSGDYVSPRLCDCLWFEKPVLYYWMASAAYRLFDVGEFAARFPSAFAATAVMILMFTVFRRLFSLGFAFVVSLVLITSGMIIGFARAATPDMTLTACMSFALIWGYLFAGASGRARFCYLALCSAAAGLAVIAKGLVGIVLVAAVLFAYLLITRQLTRISWYEPLVGLTVFAAVALAWYAPVTMKHGWHFINDFFIDHHFKRYTVDKYGHPQPVYFYLFIALAGVLPWTFYIIPAVRRSFRLRPRGSRLDSLLTLAWLWLLIPLIFFSFSQSKLPGYALPVFPALAIIVGAEVHRAWAGEKTRPLRSAGWITSGLLVALGIGFVIYMVREAPRPGVPGLLLIAAPLVCAALALLALVKGKRNALIAGAPSVVGAIIIATVTLLFPKMSEDYTTKQLSLYTLQYLRPGERIAFYVMKEYGPVFYADGRVVCGVGNRSTLNALDPRKLDPVLEADSSMVVFTTLNWLHHLEKDPRFELEPIGFQRDVLAIRLRPKQEELLPQPPIINAP